MCSCGIVGPLICAVYGRVFELEPFFVTKLSFPTVEIHTTSISQVQLHMILPLQDEGRINVLPILVWTTHGQLRPLLQLPRGVP